jgi:hypothetical protein
VFEDVSAKAGFVIPPRRRFRRSHHWIILKLVGVADNADGLGTKVKIITSQGNQYNEATTSVGYNSSSDKRVHFGVGDATVIDAIELSWPSGVHQVLTNIKVDQVLTVTEGSTLKQ